MADTPKVEGQAYTAPSDAPVGTLLTNADGQTMQVIELFAVMIDDTTKELKRGPSIGTYAVGTA